LKTVDEYAKEAWSKLFKPIGEVGLVFLGFGYGFKVLYLVLQAFLANWSIVLPEIEFPY